MEGNRCREADLCHLGRPQIHMKQQNSRNVAPTPTVVRKDLLVAVGHTHTNVDQ